MFDRERDVGVGDPFEVALPKGFCIRLIKPSAKDLEYVLMNSIHSGTLTELGAVHMPQMLRRQIGKAPTKVESIPAC